MTEIITAADLASRISLADSETLLDIAELCDELSEDAFLRGDKEECVKFLQVAERCMSLVR